MGLLNTHTMGTTTLSDSEVFVPASHWQLHSKAPDAAFDKLTPDLEQRASETYRVAVLDFPHSEDCEIQCSLALGDCRGGIAFKALWLAPRIDQPPLNGDRLRQECVLWGMAAVGIGAGDSVGREFGSQSIAQSHVERSRDAVLSPWNTRLLNKSSEHPQNLLLSELSQRVEVPATQAEFHTYLRFRRVGADPADTMAGTAKLLGVIVSLI